MLLPYRRKLTSVGSAIVSGVYLCCLVAINDRCVDRHVSWGVVTCVTRVGQFINIKEEVLGRRR